MVRRLERPYTNASLFTSGLLLQMELKLRLMELNWQKSQCVKVITADERTRSEVRVCNGPFCGIFFSVDIYMCMFCL